VELRGGVLDQLHLADIGVVMAALAEFERDLIRERIKSGIAAAEARGRCLGRQPGQCPSDRKATKVLKLAEAV
jgi:putative DNA-invertase from lambdoid prophage Rac